jgi:O-antigen ligase
MPAAASPPFPLRRVLVLAACAAPLVPLAAWIGRAPLQLPLVAAVAGVLFAASFLRTEAGLMILVASMLLSPEIPLGAAGSGGLERSRSVVLRTEDLVLLIVGLGWLARMAIHKDLGAVRRTPLNAAIAAYALACTLSTLLGILAGRVSALVALCYVLKYVEYFVIFFITVNYVRTPAQMRRLLGAVVATAAVIVLYGWWQMPQGLRPSAPFEGTQGEPNTFGGYLVLMFAVACALAFEAPVRPARVACGLTAAAAIPPLVATLSRSSWLGLGAALATLVLLLPRRRALIAFAAAGIAVLLLAMPHRVEQRVMYTFTPETRDAVHLGRVQLDSSSTARINSWGAALEGWTRHPVLGWGVTGYGFLDAQYFRVLVETGAVGLACFAALLVACLTMLRRARRELADPVARALAAGLLAGLVGLMAHAVGTNSFLLIRIMEPFWLITGLVVASLRMQEAA